MPFKLLPLINGKKIFEIVQIKHPVQLSFLDLEIKKVNKIKDASPNGIYAIFYNDELAYMGKHTAQNTDITDRWRRHLPSLTNRFRSLNFVTPSKKKLYNEKRVSFNTILKELKNSKKNYNECKEIINKELGSKLKEFSDKYKKNNFKSYNNLVDKTFNILKKIKYSDEKKNIQMLTNQGFNQTVNRIKFASLNWKEFEKRNLSNILEGFKFYYLKHITTKRLDKKEFEKKFEDKCILKFKPFANKENFSKKFEVLKPLNIDIVSILSYLNKLDQ